MSLETLLAQADNRHEGGGPMHVAKDRGNSCIVWDFTLACYGPLSARYITPEEIADLMRSDTLNWGFQQEESNDTKYVHYQGRLRLNRGDKKRLSELKNGIFGDYPWVHLSPTSANAANQRNFYTYVTKLDTRIDGPWSDKIEEDEEEAELPDDWPRYAPYPFQQAIINMWIEHMADDRVINVLVDPLTSQGKSTTLKLAITQGLKHFLIVEAMYAANPRELLLTIASYYKGLKAKKETRHVVKTVASVLIVDMPKGKKNKQELYNVLERAKSGVLVESRYETTQIIYKIPHIWVFTNELPMNGFLSPNRWKLWGITNDKELRPLHELQKPPPKMVDMPVPATPATSTTDVDTPQMELQWDLNSPGTTSLLGEDLPELDLYDIFDGF